MGTVTGQGKKLGARFLELPKYIDEIKMEICSWLVKRGGNFLWRSDCRETQADCGHGQEDHLHTERGVQITLEHAVTNHIFFWCLGGSHV
ncbi:unnamed protein product [Caretta caretta]